MAVLACIALPLAAGCAQGTGDPPGDGAESESDALVAPTVVVADSLATSAAEVLEDRLVLPLAAAERYRALAPASIFVGARGSAAGKNPDGFLRRVTSVAASGDVLVVMTTPATLTDAIVHGAVRTSNGGLSIDGSLTGRQLRSVAIDFADEPLFDGEDVIEVSGKKARFVEAIRLQRALLTTTPVVDIDLRIREGKLSRFVAKVEGNLDTSVRATATVTGEGDIDAETLAALRGKKHEVNRVVYQSPRVALPTFSVGGVPISTSVQFTVTLKCQLSFGGPLVAQAGVEAKSYVRMGAVYENAVWAPPTQSEFAIAPSFTMERAGEIEARCAIDAGAELFAFGTSGVTMSVAPYVDFNVKPDPANGYAFRVGAGATGAMRGRNAAIFGVLPQDLDRSIAEWKAPSLLEGTSP